MIKIGLIDEVDTKTVELLDNMEESASEKPMGVFMVDEKAEREKIDNLKRSQSGLGTKIVSESIEFVNQYQKITGYTLLLSQPKEKLIVEFYEAILSILIDNHIIISGSQKPRKDDIKNALKANHAYYYGETNSRGNSVTKGVLETVKNWCVLLSKAAENNKTWIDPVESFHFYSNITNSYFERWRSPFFPKKINNDKVNDFLAFLKENRIYLNKKSQTELFQDLSRMEMLYYNYGFPFMCCGVGNDDKSYSDIYEYYHNSVYAFFVSLSRIKKDSFEKYRKTLSYYINSDSALEDAIPYMVKMAAWTVDDTKFETNREGEFFVQELCERIGKVRPYRNAIVHKLANDYSDPDKQRELAEEIKEWVKEYEVRFSKQKG